MLIDYELWNIILDGPNVPIKLDAKGNDIPNERSEFNNIDHKLMKRNIKAKKILICVLGRDEYNMIFVFTCVKEI